MRGEPFDWEEPVEFEWRKGEFLKLLGEGTIKRPSATEMEAWTYDKVVVLRTPTYREPEVKIPLREYVRMDIAQIVCLLKKYMPSRMGYWRLIKYEKERS